ncbi:hypothetical protein ABT147_41705 [Streptomyces sp. NPDC001868]|uniref:hypothetical protein n=1 Tax=Streptomyces sp. NPDC001868 TaxID=3154401 RepID=UPI00331F566D
MITTSDRPYFSLVYLPSYAAGVGALEQAYASSFMTLVMVFVIAGMLVSGLRRTGSAHCG